MPMARRTGPLSVLMLGQDRSCTPPTSGGVTVRRLGGGYLHVDLSIRSALFRFEGSLEIPDAGP